MKKTSTIDGLSGAEEAGVIKMLNEENRVYHVKVTDNEFQDIWHTTYRGLTPFDELLDKIEDVRKAKRALEIENIFVI